MCNNLPFPGMTPGFQATVLVEVLFDEFEVATRPRRPIASLP